MPLSMLKSSKIIPDVVDHVLQGGGASVDVSYHSKGVTDGLNLTPKETSHAPTVHVKDGGASSFYTLICTDPDAPDPNNPTRREFLHWLVTNIPGKSGSVSDGNEVIPYMGPAPPIGTHRYIFLLFKQPNESPLSLSAPKERPNFKTRDFAKSNGLGDPIFATYFTSHK